MTDHKSELTALIGENKIPDNPDTLGGMKNIISINRRNRTAIIRPGVFMIQPWNRNNC